MPDIRFYHLQMQTLEEALPKLMEKVAGAGLRAVVKAADQATIDTLDKTLWDYDPSSFIPHDKAGCDHPADQQIYLTCGDENPNEASVLVLVDAVPSEQVNNYERCLYMFDGRDPGVVTTAREDWARMKAEDHTMSYWQQKEMGGWEQKA